MSANLSYFKEYLSHPLNIPFKEEGADIYRLKIKTKKYTSRAELNQDEAALINIAVDRYITHYFPEFYMRLSGHALRNATISGNEEVYTTLRGEILDAVTIENSGINESSLPDRTIVIFKLELPLFEIRQQLLCNTYLNPDDYSSLSLTTDQLPSFLPNLEYFNRLREVGPTQYQCQIEISSLNQTTNELSNAVHTFADQQKKGQIPSVVKNIDFNFLSKSIKKLIIGTFKEIVHELTAGDPYYRFLEGDTVTFYFAQKGADKPNPDLTLSHITFQSVNFSIVNEYMVVGYFTLVEYDKNFNDQLTLHCLKNSKRVLQRRRESAQEGTPFSLWEFLLVTAPQMLDELGYDPGALYRPQITAPGNNGENNDLLNAAIEIGVIEVEDTSGLQASATAYTSAELLVLQNEVSANAELYEKVNEKGLVRSLKTGIDINAKIAPLSDVTPFAATGQNDLLDAAGLSGNLDQVLRNFGLKQLAREAMLCLGFGIDFEVARIRLALEASLECQLSAGGNTRPYMDPSMFSMFLITGDLRREILKIILSELQKTILAIILKLAEMLRQACRRKNPYASNYGDNNLNDFINLSGPKIGGTPFDLGNEGAPGGAGLPPGGGLDEPGQIPPGPDGLSPSEVMDYLDGLSDILSGTDICTLLLYRDTISEDLMDRIIEYNKSLENAAIADNFSTPSRILELFGYLGSIADRKRVIALCDEIANAIVLLNQDNICLTEDDLRALDIDEQNNINDLLDLIENGLDPYGNGSGLPGFPAGGGLGLPPPVFNFDCPDRENYVNDPTVTRMLPEVFSNLVEFVELQFLYSADAVKKILMDTSLSANPTAGLTSSDFADGGIDAEPNDWPELPEADAGQMDIIQQIVQVLKSGGPLLDACVASLDLGATGANLAAQIELSLESPVVLNKVEELESQMAEIATSVANSSGPITTQYVFKRQFYDRFVNYIDINTRGSNVNTNDERKYWFGGTSFGQSNFQSQKYRPSGAPTGEWITFNFPGAAQTLKLNYTTYEEFPDHGSADPPLWVDLSDIMGSSNQTEFKSEVVEDFNNLTLVPYVTALKRDVSDNPSSMIDAITEYQHAYFPYTYADIVDQVFDYFIDNGIFDAASLNAVNFFHDNLNCDVGDVADLLDVEGIFNQMQDEYLESACQDTGVPARNRLRDTIKIGMFLLLIQVHVAEFIIKNIFVFSAIQLDSLFGKEFIVTYMRDQIRASIARYFDTVDARAAAKYAREKAAAEAAAGECAKTRGQFSEAIQYTEAEKIRNSIVDIFNRKMKRVSADGTQGIKDIDGNVVFPAGTHFRYDDADFYQIVDFLTEQRIVLSMGTIDSPGPTANALTEATPMTTQQTLEEIFLSSFKVFTVPVMLDDPEGSNVPLWHRTTSTGVLRRGLEVGMLNRKLEDFYDLQQKISWKAQLKEKGKDLNVTTAAGQATRPAQPSWFDSPPERTGLNPHIFWTRTHVGTFDGNVDIEYRLWQTVIKNNSSIPVLLLEIPTPLQISEDNLTIAIPGAGGWIAEYQAHGGGGGRGNGAAYAAMFDAAPLSATELDHIMAQPEYQTYFSSVFSQELITLIPIIQNFYLTNLYFGDIEKAMQTTKDRVIGILSQTIENQDHFDTRPRIRRNSARNTALSMDTPNTDTMARDYILKMLIMTPINILKGIIEMIDPHVVVTKLIKTGTGAAFNALAAELDKIEGLPPGLSGSDILEVVLCMIAAIMGNVPVPAGFPEPPANFLPRISIDGVDFTGTITGMLMIPPTPLGLIYLLLSLINIELPGPDANVAADFGYGGNTNAELPGQSATRCAEDEE